MQNIFRIGHVVPSPNTSMGAGVPAVLKARRQVRSGRFAFCSSGMRIEAAVKQGLALRAEAFGDAASGAGAPAVTSAGARGDALAFIDARRIAPVAACMTPLTGLALDPVHDQDNAAVNRRARAIPDHLETARHDRAALPALAVQVDVGNVDAGARQAAQAIRHDRHFSEGGYRTYGQRPGAPLGMGQARA